LGSVIYVIATLFLNTMTFSLGEEIGWRGYLLPRLLPLGETSAFTLTGLIWALWHFPLIFLGKRNFEAGQLIPKTLLFTLTLVAISSVVGRLWIRHRSLWVAALFHSAHNTVWGLWGNLILPTSTVTLWAGESGIISLVLYTLIALGMWQKARKTTAQQRCVN
ncbi:MAG: CPBP family intramembrane metalloprotease, partial [Thermanaerothrix sp.]|nr:CPBP family intramembrane metalloprotease [Thermanaerothrix sp.]